MDYILIMNTFSCKTYFKKRVNRSKDVFLVSRKRIKRIECHNWAISSIVKRGISISDPHFEQLVKIISSLRAAMGIL